MNLKYHKNEKMNNFQDIDTSVTKNIFLQAKSIASFFLNFLFSLIKTYGENMHKITQNRQNFTVKLFCFWSD